MRKLVIGCGYLGRRVAAAWLQDGHRVTALTRSEEHAEQFRAQSIEPVIGDVTDPDSLSALPDVETALYAVGYDRGSDASMQEVYVNGLDNVLAVLAPRVRRLIYISSSSVYGQTGGEWVDELSRCKPARPNGQACLDAERVVWRHFPSENQSSMHGANVLRLAGIYGPGRLFSRMQSLQSGEPLSGNPDAYLNLIHVDDAVQTVVACEERGKTGTTYLVCDDRPLTRREYYETLASYVDAPVPTFDQTTQNNSPVQGLNKRCRNRKLREELGVELIYPSIETGLPQALSVST